MTDTPPSPPTASALRFLPALTLVAVLTITASAEFELARTVLALPPHIAWALPVAVDSYVLAAMRSGRDIPAALAVMAGSLAASMGAHLAAAEYGGELPPHVVAPAATAIMTVLVVVAWRVHVLIGHTHPAETTPQTDQVAVPTPPAPSTQPSQPPKATDTPSTPGRARAAVTPKRPPAAITADKASRGTASDEQLVAEAGRHFREAGIYPPSIRALMRTYAIGQNRATRIHAAITSTAPETTEADDQTDQAEKATSTSPDESSSESTESAEPFTHTCITDRVGPPSPAEESAAPDSGDSHQPQELTTVATRNAEAVRA